MPSTFETYADFLISIKTIDVLVGFAKQEGKNGNDDNRALFLKLSVASIVTKLQVFVERILEEFLYKLKGSQKKYRDLPLHARLRAIYLILSESKLDKKLEDAARYNEEQLKKISQHLFAIQNICDEDITINSDSKFTISTKFPLGKTGAGQLKNLFKQIEGKDFFEGLVDIDKLNEILDIRHRIIHKDTNPQLTEVKIAEYKDYIQEVALHINNYLSGIISPPTNNTETQ